MTTHSFRNLVRTRWRFLLLLTAVKVLLLASCYALADEEAGAAELAAHRELTGYLISRSLPDRKSLRPAMVPPSPRWPGSRPSGDRSGPGSLPGLIVPLAAFRLTSEYSTRRWHPVTGGYRPHWGIDLAAPIGTTVRAAGSGEVVFVGWDDGGGGNVVKIDHGNGYLTAYLHLSSVVAELQRGAWVDQGETIGYVGSTGLSTAPHLDYRVSYQGRWIDPQSIQSFKQ